MLFDHSEDESQLWDIYHWTKDPLVRSIIDRAIATRDLIEDLDKFIDEFGPLILKGALGGNRVVHVEHHYNPRSYHPANNLGYLREKLTRLCSESDELLVLALTERGHLSDD